MTVKLPTRVEDTYEKFIIKEYHHWTLFLHHDQRYLGRVYAWLKRPGEMQDFFDIYPQEEFELFRIGDRYKSATRNLWQPDTWNYAWLGNLIKEHKGHGHMHLIPRYKEKRTFAGQNFFDGRWGQNYVPYAPHKPGDKVLFNIRDAIREVI